MLWVRIILAYRARVPRWLKELSTRPSRVKIDRFPKYGEGRTYRAIEIDGGIADFFPGGVVDVKMPGSNEYIPAFGPMKVMLITYPGSGVVKHNHCFCKKCYALTGRKIGTVPGDSHSRVHIDMKCEVCGNEWRIKNA